MNTPESYARHLATYIASPLKIEAYTRLEFNRAPPLHRIAQLRFEIEQAERRLRTIERLQFSQQPDQPPVVEIEAEATPQEEEAPIPQPEPPAENPFVGRYSTGRRLIATVAQDFGLTPAEAIGAGRAAYLVDARALVAKLLRMRGKSYPEIGQIIGRRDHSTAINLVSKFDIYCRRNPILCQSYERHLALMEEADRQREAQAEEAA